MRRRSSRCATGSIMPGGGTASTCGARAWSAPWTAPWTAWVNGSWNGRPVGFMVTCSLPAVGRHSHRDPTGRDSINAARKPDRADCHFTHGRFIRTA
ncbi:hypothetical protein Sru01_51000 [Sphaerisporangium rufum]|uniref:Uncharacterized protein n=1 Tax=Sphaerisporangium rufum TaxID=1381558 RepID=A0A919R6F1_9ACTN|nr:hypothetical protein Sru01_51000 [Sphaerisporangium rufum]